jgi:hypothetical protein
MLHSKIIGLSLTAILMNTFLKEVQVRFPDYKITPLDTTSHKNVLRLSKDGHSFVAKTIWHDRSDPKGDMGIKAQDNAYETEVKILSMLPKWWGIHLIDHFKTKTNRIIVTNEIVTIPWRRKGLASLSKQIKWLHAHRIAHNDLELKNILYTVNGPIIIDFEKARFMASKEMMLRDYTVLFESIHERRVFTRKLK